MSDTTETGSRAILRSRRALIVLGKLALAAGVFVAAFLVAECGHRLWLAKRGDPHDPWQALSGMRRRADPARSFLGPIRARDPERVAGTTLGILHPFFGSEQEHDTGRVLEHFRRGNPEDEYTVVIVGGSVAASFAVTVGENLAALLEEDPRLAGRKVTTLNYAHTGFKQPQQLTRVAWLMSLGYRPDAIINLDGFNEVAVALRNVAIGTHYAFPSFPQWGVLVQDYDSPDPEQLDLIVEFWEVRKRAQKLLDQALSWRLYRSSLFGRAVLGRLDELNRDRAELQTRLESRRSQVKLSEPMKRQLHGPPDFGGREVVLERCVSTWFDCSRALDAMCGRMGTRYLHVLQPTLGDVGSKRLTEKEKAIPFPSPEWERGPREGYPMLRESGRKLAQDGVAFLDASRTFEDLDETLYYDSCHFNQRGQEILCEIVAKAFRDQILGR